MTTFARQSATPSSEEFYRLAEEHDLIPLVRSFDGLPDLPALYRTIRQRGRGFILESGKGGEYSYVGSGMIDELVVESEESGDPFEQLRRFLGSYRVYSHPDLENFAGGGIGSFSYDLARAIERLPVIATDDLSFPLLHIVIPELFIEIDQRRGGGVIAVMARIKGEERERAYAEATELIEMTVESIQQVLGSASTPHSRESTPQADIDSDKGETSLTKEEFEEIVRRAIEYIHAGDIFQVNLSLRSSHPFEGDPFRLYQALRRINPAPYMAFHEYDQHAIVSSSPELLLKVKGQELSTRPIAGTRKRGATEEEDRLKTEELVSDEKERAEHLMLVDLERNDLGRVSRYGSVEVDEFMTVEKYSHVIHIVSNVRGELAEGYDMIDAIRATFPGGTITGAPKVRAMEIIEELEPVRRGIYTGSIGWVGFNGDAELNIAIRTILVQNGIAYAQAGAGIVADSVPGFEYKESLRKAEAMFRALEEWKNV